ncbi:hypothetical protein M885DRAFT_562692, partial [Pelagophyceae sp. CCMP2097]
VALTIRRPTVPLPYSTPEEHVIRQSPPPPPPPASPATSRPSPPPLLAAAALTRLPTSVPPPPPPEDHAVVARVIAMGLSADDARAAVAAGMTEDNEVVNWIFDRQAAQPAPPPPPPPPYDATQQPNPFR